MSVPQSYKGNLLTLTEVEEIMLFGSHSLISGIKVIHNVSNSHYVPRLKILRVYLHI